MAATALRLAVVLGGAGDHDAEFGFTVAEFGLGMVRVPGRVKGCHIGPSGFKLLLLRLRLFDAMLTRLNRRLRWRTALALVGLYAFCILMPSAALAFASAAAHCLTDTHGKAHVHQAAATKHIHADGSTHTHERNTSHAHADDGAPTIPGNADDQKHEGNCCGLFCVTAISHESPAAIAAPVAASRIILALADFLPGHDPGRINRPPRR